MKDMALEMLLGREEGAGGEETAGQYAQMSTLSLPGVQTNRKTLNFSNWGAPFAQGGEGGARDWTQNRRL